MFGTWIVEFEENVKEGIKTPFFLTHILIEGNEGKGMERIFSLLNEDLTELFLVYCLLLCFKITIVFWVFP